MSASHWAAPVLATLLAVPAAGQASLIPIPAGPAAAVSPDGTTVAGTSASGGGGYVWSQAAGATLLGETDAVGVNAAGTQAYGNMVDPASGFLSAGVHTLGAGWQALLGLPGDPGCSFDFSSASAWSDDGTVATGRAWQGCQSRAFRWTPSTGMTPLPMTATGPTRGNAVSGDGQFIGGWDQASGNLTRAALWKPDGSVDLILQNQPGNPDGFGETRGLSGDGTFAVGSSIPGGFLWSAGQVLAVFEATSSVLFSVPRAVSDDGETVVGSEGGAGVFGAPHEAWIWREGSGVEWVADVVEHYGLPSPGFSFSHATDVTPDLSLIHI